MKYDAVVVGAGFAGMYMLHRLRKLGFSVRVLEAGGGVGGTWYWNRYPGARCDVQSLDYSYSFDEDLQQEWEWSEKYATQPEILRYANHVADRFDLRRDIQFDTRVESARFVQSTNTWQIENDGGDVLSCQFYIMASGCLSVPKAIGIPNHEAFKSSAYHTANWPPEGVDFTGQRVAVIGTGSSAIQTMPIVAKQAAELTVFQRTPAFSLPAFNRALSTEEVADRKAVYTEHREKARYSLFGIPDTDMAHGAFDVSDEERDAAYERAWQTGTLNDILTSFNDLLVNQQANDTAAEFVRNKIRSIVKNPDTAEILCPKHFPFGTKRACLDTGYYEMFNAPHVRLVDLRQTPLVSVTAAGIKTSSTEYDFDSIIFATGFDAMTGAIVSVDIRGAGGLPLKDKWSAGPRTYLGLCIAGFPNLFTVTGPGSPSVLTNMMTSIEQHVDWIAECMTFMRDEGHAVIEASEQAETAWVEHVNEVADATLFPVANSWYMGANVPGKPRVFMPYIGGFGAYHEKCDEVAGNTYDGFQFSGAVAKAEQPASAG